MSEVSVSRVVGLQRIIVWCLRLRRMLPDGGVGICGVVMLRFGGVDGVSEGGRVSWVCGIGLVMAAVSTIDSLDRR